MEHFHARLDDIALYVATDGEGQPVVLLHGFPEFWYSWRYQLPALSAAGFRALAPDLRGYNLSGRPCGIRHYRVNALVADVVQLIERHAGGKAHVVGHDWGGVIAWRLAALRPDVLRKLVILNGPHPAAFRRVLLTNPLQWVKSLYVLVFQLPWLAEWLIGAGDFWLLEQALRTQPSNKNAFSEDDIRRYKQALRQPGAIAAALNYYRAALRFSRDLSRPPQMISAPTLVIWGERDPYLTRQLTQHLDRWIVDLRVERLPNISHWVQNDASATVNRLLIDFLQA